MKKKLITFLITITFFGTMLVPVSGYNTEFQNTKDLDFDKKIDFFMKLGHMPSLSACIVKKDSVIWSNSYGLYDLKNNKPASQDTVYMIGSISKMFAAFAIMQLYEQGLFELDDNISNYLPFHIANPNYPNVNITFRMLLAHQSSLAEASYSIFILFTLLGYSYDWLNEFLTPGGYMYYPRNWRNYPPGEEHEYSNLGYEILGHLVEKISNQSFVDYCEEHIFKPLGMKNSSFHLSDFNIDNIALPYFWLVGKYLPLPLYELKNYAAGGLKSTICDLSKFLIVHLNGGVYNETRYLKESTIELMQTIQYPNGNDGFAWKFVEFSDGKTYLVHSGTIPGYHSRLSIYPPDSIGIIFSYNQYHGIPVRDEIRLIGRIEKYAFRQIERLLYEKGYEQ
jgi:CubicO group peptidase (beta-lactamase class C family)